MNLEGYEILTGTTVPSTKTAQITATIARTQTILETLLGFTLDPDEVETNLYNELGKSNRDCFCPSVDLEDLQPPDAVVGAYRLFRYNDLDKYFHVDPFSVLHKAKLVFIKGGTGANGITIKTFDTEELRVNYGRDGLAKYIEHCTDCLCICECNDCVQLAVDADWLWTEAQGVPEDLQYLWADMVTWYADSKNKKLRSESIDTHSYTFATNTAPELEPQNLAILKKYAGPYGSVSVMPV